MEDLAGARRVGDWAGLSARRGRSTDWEAAIGGLRTASVCAVARWVSRNGEGIGVCKYALGGIDSDAVGMVVRVRASRSRGVREDKNEGGIEQLVEKADDERFGGGNASSSDRASCKDSMADGAYVVFTRSVALPASSEGSLDLVGPAFGTKLGIEDSGRGVVTRAGGIFSRWLAEESRTARRSPEESA